VYSYDVATATRSSSNRSIPSMRPSYDAEHPTSPTPIYDSLYSEYRRLFRSLPGDRSNEENMRFTGFAVRDPHGVGGTDGLPYPQHQAFHTFPGHTLGTPQYMPIQPGIGTHGSGAHGTGTHEGNSGHFNNTGQGWVAAGYLAPQQSQHSAAEPSIGGRHRSMLSLPPGRSDGQG
jgi:hypothetical protein